MKGPLLYDDPDLLRFVKQYLMYPPSDLPYNLVMDHINTSLVASRYYAYYGEFAYAFYARALREIFAGTRRGFFVEAGALDGEYLSNTLVLEKKLGWTGLLVESNGDSFKELLTKRRKAWASHSCLAVHEYPHQDVMVKFRREVSSLDHFADKAASAHSMMVSQDKGQALDNSSPGHREYEAMQCLPLATLLLAINITRVNLISLDVEGAEMGVLRHFPWDRITVDVWLVEHMPQDEDKLGYDFIKMFSDRGYELYRADSNRNNFVFVLRSAEVYSRVRKGEKKDG
ncbi:protein Star-like [Penaeus japonicus]|uniref:protein Star-like n=1 Tax=Penaeus japonicus TaxID=27405 RepID=UPI001C71626D|nr:protein Star-like [Penaeus japonicus]